MEQACLSAEKTGKNISSAAGVDANSVRSVKTVNVHRGDIYYADLSPVVGSEQGGVRLRQTAGYFSSAGSVPR